MDTRSPHTSGDSQCSQNPRAVPVPVAPELEVEPIDRDAPIIPVNKRISWLGWITALMICLVRLEFGLILIITLLVFRQFPTLNLKGLPRKAGLLFKKLRS